MRLAVRHPMIVMVLGLVGLVLPVATSSATVRADGPALVGGGSSFASLEIDAWRAETAKNPYNLSINYQSTGSSAGRQQYITGDLDFAVSDIPFRPDEQGALDNSGRNAFVYVPVSAGGLAMMYNLTDLNGQRVTALNLTRAAVCKMFTVPNFMWDDPEIANVNPGLRLPSAPVQPIVRSDGSGTSYVLSEYCSTVVPQIWQTFVAFLQNEPSLDPTFLAGGATSNWPSGWGITQSANGADNVAAAVANTSNSITYNETGYAPIYGLSIASVQNQANVFTQPTEDAVSVALGYASGRPDGTFILDYDGPDPTAYFPSTYSYAIAQTAGFDSAKGEVLARFLCYSITRGQRKDLLDKLKYARLSAPLVEIGKNNIAKIPGAPAWEQCRVDSAAPPPAATTIPPAAATTLPPPPGGGGGTTATTTPGAGTAPLAGGTTTTVAAASGSGSGGAPAASVPSGAGSGSTGGGGTGSGSGGSTGGTVTGGAASGAEGSSATIVSIDPVTGATTFETIAVDPDVTSTTGVQVASESGCVDPLTGLPADAATCAGAVVGGAAVSADPLSAVGAPPAAIQYNPTVDTSAKGPTLTKILWWLLQGASVCAIGVALAGVRKRIA